MYVGLFHNIVVKTQHGEFKIFLYFVQMSIVFIGTEPVWISWWVPFAKPSCRRASRIPPCVVGPFVVAPVGFRLGIFDFSFTDLSQGYCLAPLAPIWKLFFGLAIPIICMAELAVSMAFLASVWWFRHGRKGHKELGYKFYKSPYFR